MGFIQIVEDQERFDLEVGDSILILRRFDSQVYKEIEKKHTVRKKHFRSGQMIEDSDSFAINEDLLDYMLTDWKDVKSPTTGEDVPCTRENKIKLPSSVKLQITEACDADSVTSEKKTSTTSSDNL